MKQKKKKQQKKTPFYKKTSYIGVCTFLIAGLISILALRHTQKILLPSESNIPITLPPAPTLFPTSSPEPVVLPAQAPIQAEDESAPASAPQEPFQIGKPSQGDIIKPFMAENLIYSKTTADWRTHTAIDFSAVVTKTVVAAAEGTVEKVYQDPLMGHTVIILHADDFRTSYQNLTPDILVKEGESVTQGQHIGEAGNSAPLELNDVAHLHFELSQNNKAVNPLDYFSDEN